MYVVRRPFRNYGVVLEPGSIVEPDSIKWFKTRLRDKVIVEVTEQTFDNWNAYFMTKFGVSIKLATVPEKQPEKPKPAKPVQAAKVVVKA